MKENKRAALTGMTFFAMLFLVLGLAGSAFAHPDIPLRNAAGTLIATPAPGTLADAYSAKTTCGACHNGSDQQADYDVNGDLVIDGLDTVFLLSYDNIENHTYHAQLGANEFRGWNIWNPDSADKYKKGPAAKGKNWVQSPAHYGKW